mmetsp:Transcript_6483/g.13588  ORF Transcript_6483/g.13588 Transcript_6483/m.13588 type:complete len:151 (+) Transcript_6483:83-535(+)
MFTRLNHSLQNCVGQSKNGACCSYTELDPWNDVTTRHPWLAVAVAPTVPALRQRAIVRSVGGDCWTVEKQLALSCCFTKKRYVAIHERIVYCTLSDSTEATGIGDTHQNNMAIYPKSINGQGILWIWGGCSVTRPFGAETGQEQQHAPFF